jgi:hypothetical protein
MKSIEEQELQGHFDRIEKVIDGASQALGYATRLAEAIARKHYPEVPQFRVLPDLMGILTQIDNMTSGLTRAPKESNEID